MSDFFCNGGRDGNPPMPVDSSSEKWSYLYNELTKLCIEARCAGCGFSEYPDLHGFHTVLRMMEQADGFTFGKKDR